ncbi:MAG: Ig-like domain-containing protein [Luteolibacter sp.]
MKTPLLSSGKRRLAFAGAALFAPFVSYATPLPGLIHHWNFDEGPDWHDSAYQTSYPGTTAYNYGASMPAATLKNMTAANWVSGRQFTALSFNGSNQYVDAATNLASTLGGTASLSCWLRTTQTGPSASTNAPGITGSSASGGVQFGWIDNTGRIALSVDNVLVARSAQPVNDNLWHHVVITRNASTGAAQVFVDGVLSASATGATGVKSAAFTSLGRIENGGAAAYFQGRLDQITVFNTVIAAGTVTTLQTNHAPKAWDTTTDGVNTGTFTTKSVFANCYDVERQTLSVASFTQPAHGSVVHNGDGSFSFSATTGYLGKDAFTVVIEDGNGGYHRVTMNVNIATEPVGGGVPLLTYGGFTALQANGADFDKSGLRVPRAIDWDGDGKLDLLLGAGGYVWLYLNTGTVNAPAFGAGTKVKANGSDIYVNTTSSSPIALVDMTGDGVRDLVVSDSASKLRIYRNTSAAGAPPVFAAATFAKTSANADLVLADRRFDIGDWDGDGLVDIVTGTFSGNLLLYTNTGTAAAPKYGTGQVLFGDSYNLYPRLYDLNGNGSMDLLWAINWGSVSYWRDAAANARSSASSNFAISLADGSTADVRAVTDGAVVDIADFNGDGSPDMIFGGHAGAQILIAYGVPKTVTQSIAAIEAIYDANAADLGTALSANSNALLNQINSANLNLIAHIETGTPAIRTAVYNALAAHIAKYPFLKYQTLNTTTYHHVPSIVLQNWVMLGYAKPDTPTHRAAVADIMGLTGTMRDIYLENKLALGDNAKSISAAYGTIRDFLRRHPRELFPDAVVTIDQLNGDGRGGFIWTPNSTKNTFADSAIGSANEWASDLTSAIQGVLGSGKASGDYFTFVLGHEVTHSLDAYVNGRANKDLRRRWGLTLMTAAGPDVIATADGWRDVAATKANFQTKGLWDGVEANWSTAWTNYWTTGAGAVFRNTSFMRGSIDWFLDSSQESLATQGNHHWANGPGRLIGAVDRFRRASAAGAGPLKANINEVVTFIDFLSAGMNRVNLVETKYQASPKQVNWFDHFADLERDDNGRVTKVSVDGYIYDLTVNADGVVTDVDCSIATLVNDSTTAVSGDPKVINVGANDTRLDGKPVIVHSFTQPANGQVTAGAAGQLVYRSNAGFTGSNSFTYKVGLKTATVTVSVSAATSSVFDRWLQSYGLLAAGNPDGDRMTNLFEYAFGTDPNVHDGHSIVTDGSVIVSSGMPRIEVGAGGLPAKVFFARHKNPQLAGLTYTPQFSSNLKDWFDGAAGATAVAENDLTEIVTSPFPVSLPDSSVPRFFRMKVATY